MARVLVLYNPPADPAAFDRYYWQTHVPIAKKLPGLRSYVTSAGAIAPMGGGPAPHLVAELEFDSVAAVQAAVASPEGQATTGDLANFAQAGATILVFETREA